MSPEPSPEPRPAAPVMTDLPMGAPKVSASLIYNGDIYLTELRQDGVLYGGTIIADSWDEAERMVRDTGRDERVIGRLEMSLYVEMDQAEADAIARQLGRKGGR